MKYVNRAGGCQPGWRRKVDSLVTLLLPWHCVLCGLSAQAPGLCGVCRSSLPGCGEACPRCGLPLPDVAAASCGACQQHPPPYDRVHAAMRYDFPVRQLVQQYKFQRNLAAGAVLARLLADRLIALRSPAPELLVAVPLHWWRGFRRGFNQAGDLARILARDLGLELSVNELRRTRHTVQQAGLSARDRRRNLVHAFAWRGRPLHDQHVALVDDVMTTGTTVAECAAILKHAGARRVDVWVAARAVT